MHWKGCGSGVLSVQRHMGATVTVHLKDLLGFFSLWYFNDTCIDRCRKFLSEGVFSAVTRSTKRLNIPEIITNSEKFGHILAKSKNIFQI